MKSLFKSLHRYVSLAFASVWLVQALTGVLMVFHWELDDALVAGEHRPLSVRELGDAAQRVQAQHPHARLTALYATAGAPDRFDLYLEDAAGRTDIVRVDGAGRALLERPLDHDYARAGFIQAAIVMHQTLFAGDRGKLFIGCSGIVLFSNILMGLVLAWPRRRDWKRALLPTATRQRVANLFAWHRACGLWLALPAMVLVGAGAMLAFEGPVEAFFGTDAAPPELATVPASQVDSLTTAIVTPAVALQRGLDRFPTATLASLRMPAPGAPWYRVRVRQPGEAARVYGTTAIYVSAVDGRVLAVDDPLRAGLNRRGVDALYPLHTGEIGGWLGRLVSLSVALWLLGMLVLGVSLWSGRRRSRRVLSAVT